MITVCNFAYSQRITYAVTTQNDTITNLTLKNEGLFKGSLLMSLQEKLTVTNKQGITKS